MMMEFLQNNPQPLSNDTAVATVPGQEGEDLLAVLEKDFKRLKAQKARSTGGVEGRVLLNLAFLADEQYVDYRNKTLSSEPREKNKLYLSFNLITPRFTKLIGRLSAFNAPFKARPDKKDPQAIEDAEIVDRMIIATDEKLDEPSRMRERLFWMLSAGVAFEHVPWVPNANIEPAVQYEGSEVLFTNTQTNSQVTQSQMDQLIQMGMPPEAFEPVEEVQLVGEVGSEILGPLNVFIDQGARSISDLSPDQWVHIAQVKTLGWFQENFTDSGGDKVEAMKDINLVTSKFAPELGESTGGVFLKDLIPLVQGSADENDPPMAIHVQSYQVASTKNPHGKYVCWVPGQLILHQDENPYEEVPLVDFHWSPVTTSFWTKDYISPLISAQRFINKRMSQLGEQSNNAIYSPLLTGGAIKAGDIPADYPGVIEGGLTPEGAKLVDRVPPPELPAWFLPSIEMAVKMFNDAAGGADLMEDNKFPGQLRGPNAVPMLQEILDTQWGPLFTHLGERLARVKQMRLNRVKQFYEPVRTMHYTAKDQKDEVLQFHTEKILRAGTNFNITVERGAILPELRALREARVSERLQGPLAILYMDERTGKLDKGKIASDLAFGDVGRESREAAQRKLANEIISMLWKGQPIPPVLPFYDHTAHLDELEAAMSTTEYLKASPPIQQGFNARYEQHRQFLAQEAAMQQNAMQQHMIQSSVAQATQMAAAKAASEAVDSTREQMGLQAQQPTSQYISQAESQRQGAQHAQNGPKSPPKRKIVVEER
jgi:hypothetical protein